KPGSIRRRGSVQLTHIMTKTSSQPLAMNTAALITLPKRNPSQSVRSAGADARSPGPGIRPVCQPPKNSSVAIPLTANLLPYSAMKKNDQRKPLYSVWKPATNSLSASARSNGARLQLAVAHVKYVQKAPKVNGS